MKNQLHQYIKQIFFRRATQKGSLIIFVIFLFILMAIHTIEISREMVDHVQMVERVTARELAGELAFDAAAYLQRDLSQQALEQLKPSLQRFLNERAAGIKASEIRNADGSISYNPQLFSSIMPSLNVWSISNPISVLKNLPHKTQQHLPLYETLQETLNLSAKEKSYVLEAADKFTKNEYDYSITTKFAGRQILIGGRPASPGITPQPAIEMYRWIATVRMKMRVYNQQELPLRFDYDIVALVSTATPDIYVPPCQSGPGRINISGFSDGRLTFFCNPVPPGVTHDDGRVNSRTDGMDEYDCYSVETLTYNAMVDPARYEDIRKKYLENGGLEDIHDGLKQGENLNGSVLGNGTGQRNQNTKNLILVGDRIDNKSVGAIKSDCGSQTGSNASKTNLTNNNFEVSVTTKLVAVFLGFEVAKQPIR
jgi:hypothetical protein